MNLISVTKHYIVDKQGDRNIGPEAPPFHQCEVRIFYRVGITNIKKAGSQIPGWEKECLQTACYVTI